MRKKNLSISILSLKQSHRNTKYTAKKKLGNSVKDKKTPQTKRLLSNWYKNTITQMALCFICHILKQVNIVNINFY